MKHDHFVCCVQCKVCHAVYHTILPVPVAIDDIHHHSFPGSHDRGVSGQDEVDGTCVVMRDIVVVALHHKVELITSPGRCVHDRGIPPCIRSPEKDANPIVEAPVETIRVSLGQVCNGRGCSAFRDSEGSVT